MTTDRDMDAGAAIAATLAAERAPLEAQLAEARDGLRALVKWVLGGPALSGPTAFQDAHALVARWDGGAQPQVTGHCPTCATVARERDEVRAEVERAEGQREMLRAALRDEQAASHRELEELRAKLAEAERERDLAIGLMTQAGVEHVPDDCDGKLLGQVELMRQMWAADRAEVERLRAGHRASNAEIERLTNLAGARGGEVERLRAELAYARRRPGPGETLCLLERGARWGIEAFEAKARAWGHWDIAHMLSAADVVRAARERGSEVERVEGQASEPLVERDEPLTRADLDAFRGELVAALRHLVRGCAGDEPLDAEFAEQLADKLETGR